MSFVDPNATEMMAIRNLNKLQILDKQPKNREKGQFTKLPR